MGMRRAIALRLLPAYAGGALPPVLRRWMAAVVADDVDVAVAYDALRRLERRAAADAPLSSGQQELLLRQLLDDVTPAAPAAGRWWGSLTPALGAAACAALLLSVGDDDLRARGAKRAALGVHVRCVVDGAVVDEASAGARQTGADLECAPNGLLAFSTTNLSPGPQFVFVVGIDGASKPVWLPPFSPSSTAVAIAPGSADAVLQTLARLPAAGDLTLFVLLADSPFGGSDVERRLVAAARGGVPLAQLDRLPVDVATQARLTVRRPRAP